MIVKQKAGFDDPYRQKPKFDNLGARRINKH